MSHRPPRAGHLFDLSSLSGRAGFTAAYSEKGLVYLSVCGDNENCANGVGECGLPSTLPLQRRDQMPSSAAILLGSGRGL